MAYSNQKIGVGIVTCKRPVTFKPLLQSVLSCMQVDNVEVVKNKDFDYGDADPCKLVPGHAEVILEDVGVGACKNIAMKKLLAAGCQHIFIIEDDIKIKDTNVFAAYIGTAKEFNIEHMNYGRTHDEQVYGQFYRPIMSLKHGNFALDFFRRLSGAFQYFTADALREVGLMDEQYINMLEHCEHTYRMSLAGKCPPFYIFADVHNSDQYLEDTGKATSIVHDAAYLRRIQNVAALFKKQHGILLAKVPIPTVQQAVDYLDMRLDMKKGS